MARKTALLDKWISPSESSSFLTASNIAFLSSESVEYNYFFILTDEGAMIVLVLSWDEQ